MTNEQFALFIKYVVQYLMDSERFDVAACMMKALQDLQNTP